MILKGFLHTLQKVATLVRSEQENWATRLSREEGEGAQPFPIHTSVPFCTFYHVHVLPVKNKSTMN